MRYVFSRVIPVDLMEKSLLARNKNGDDGGWRTSTTRALSHVCRKQWRKLPLVAGSPNPMRINSATGTLALEQATKYRTHIGKRNSSMLYTSTFVLISEFTVHRYN